MLQSGVTFLICRSGDDEIATIIADANLVDARIGALIIAYPDLTVVLAVGQGLAGIAVQGMIDNASRQSPAEKVVGSYGQTYRGWLLDQTWRRRFAVRPCN